MKEKIGIWTFGFLFISFLALYISQNTGYYEFSEHRKMALTEESIRQFEKDVKNGKEVDINTYLKDVKKNNSNKLSDMGLSLSKKIEKTVKGGIEGAFKFLEKFINS